MREEWKIELTAKWLIFFILSTTFFKVFKFGILTLICNVTKKLWNTYKRNPYKSYQIPTVPKSCTTAIVSERWEAPRMIIWSQFLSLIYVQFNWNAKMICWSCCWFDNWEYVESLLLLQVPCRMAWAIIDLHCSLSWQLWITSQLLSSCNQPLMLSSCFILCLPLSLVPSILPVVINSSIFPSLTIWPKNFICCSLIPFSNSFFTPTDLSTSSLIFRSVQLIFCILLQHWNSKMLYLHQKIIEKLMHHRQKNLNLNVTPLVGSFMYTRKDNGPKTDPCETPAEMHF